jgi:hypothetical protein
LVLDKHLECFILIFSTDLGITLSQFGFALGLQMFLWGAFAPWFGVITDKYGGHIAVFIGFHFLLTWCFDVSLRI